MKTDNVVYLKLPPTVVNKRSWTIIRQKYDRSTTKRGLKLVVIMLTMMPIMQVLLMFGLSDQIMNKEFYFGYIGVAYIVVLYICINWVISPPFRRTKKLSHDELT